MTEKQRTYTWSPLTGELVATDPPMSPTAMAIMGGRDRFRFDDLDWSDEVDSEGWPKPFR